MKRPYICYVCIYIQHWVPCILYELDYTLGYTNMRATGNQTTLIALLRGRYSMRLAGALKPKQTEPRAYFSNPKYRTHIPPNH
jgi:hypothetical protein